MLSITVHVELSLDEQPLTPPEHHQDEDLHRHAEPGHAGDDHYMHNRNARIQTAVPTTTASQLPPLSSQSL